ncbi:hypothetical protein Q1695_007160 [Nippostrongylus brasiliensis]|nr:hypothetical protein Q1695_007160 [Nippostrongylus brasiliensis]
MFFHARNSHHHLNLDELADINQAEKGVKKPDFCVMKRTLCLALLLLATTVGVESACQPLLPLRHRTVKYFSSTGQELYVGPFPTGTRAVASCPKGMIIAGATTATCGSGQWKLGSCF